MSKIIDYKIVNIEDVLDFLQVGWQPFNSPFMGQLSAFQAMVKYEDGPKEETPKPKLIITLDDIDEAEKRRGL